MIKRGKTDRVKERKREKDREKLLRGEGEGKKTEGGVEETQGREGGREVSFSAYSLREVVIKPATLDIRSAIARELGSFFSNMAALYPRKRSRDPFRSFRLLISCGVSALDTEDSRTSGRETRHCLVDDRGSVADLSKQFLLSKVSSMDSNKI